MAGTTLLSTSLALAPKALQLGYSKVCAAMPEKPSSLKQAEQSTSKLLDPTGIEGFEKEKQLPKIALGKKTFFALPTEFLLKPQGEKRARNAARLKLFLEKCGKAGARFVWYNESGDEKMLKTPAEIKALLTQTLGVPQRVAQAAAFQWPSEALR